LEVFSQEVSLSVKVCCTCFAAALDEPNNKSIEGQSEDDFYATSLGYLAEQFESHAVNITQRLQQLDHSSDDFFQVLIVTRLLGILSVSTGLQSNLAGLQERTSLLVTCVGWLHLTMLVYVCV